MNYCSSFVSRACERDETRAKDGTRLDSLLDRSRVSRDSADLAGHTSRCLRRLCRLRDDLDRRAIDAAGGVEQDRFADVHTGQ